jgi:hypothetical protein
MILRRWSWFEQRTIVSPKQRSNSFFILHDEYLVVAIKPTGGYSANEPSGLLNAFTHAFAHAFELAGTTNRCTSMSSILETKAT